MPGNCRGACRLCPGEFRLDTSGADHSSEVTEIVLQLLALNTSAKRLAAPSVISILAP
jgi:hypothetical protein